MKTRVILSVLLGAMGLSLIGCEYEEHDYHHRDYYYDRDNYQHHRDWDQHHDRHERHEHHDHD